MWADGYDYQTILKAENSLQRAKQVETIIAQIESAFSDTVLGDGIGLWGAQGLDDYEDAKICAEYREKDEWMDRTAIPLETLQRCNSGPSFLDADWVRFHLPAFMCAELREDYGFSFDYSLISFSIRKGTSGKQQLYFKTYFVDFLTDFVVDFFNITLNF